MHIDLNLQFMSNYCYSSANFNYIQPSIQIGIASWTILIVQCIHYFYFKNTISSIETNSNSLTNNCSLELLNFAIPLYLFSTAWELENVKIRNFSGYLNYHLKFLIPGAICGLLIFFIKYFDSTESCYSNFICESNINWIHFLPYRLGMLTYYLYHFLISIIMYPIFCLINENELESGYLKSNECDHISGSEFFDDLDNELSNKIEVCDFYFQGFQNMEKFNKHSKLKYMISNIFIYFFLINVFYYYSLGYKLYLLYTFFYLSIFIIFSLRYVHKYVNINGICIFINIIYISLLIFAYSKSTNLQLDDITTFFKTLFLLITYYFTGYTLIIPNLQYNLQKYFVDFILLLPVIYTVFNFHIDNLTFSPFFFPIIAKNEDIIYKIVYTWIGIIFTLSILHRYLANRTLNKKIVNIFSKLPYILLIIMTFVSFIYERTTSLTINFNKKI